MVPSLPLMFVVVVFIYCSPSGDPEKPLKMLLFDSWYDQYKGVVCVMAIIDGTLKKGEEDSRL